MPEPWNPREELTDLLVQGEGALYVAGRKAADRLAAIVLSWFASRGLLRPYVQWMATAPEQLIIRACRADLERLNDHAPKRTAMEKWAPQLDGLLVDWLCGGHGLLQSPPYPCTEVLRLATVYEVGR